MISIRESFGAKLLSALLGTVGLLLVGTVLVVRNATAREVEAVTASTVERARLLFEERSEFQRQVVGTMAGPFVESRRAVVALDEATRSNDFDYFAESMEYDVRLLQLTDALVVFTDRDGLPVLSIVGGERQTGKDPAGVQPFVEQLIAEDSELLEASGYRVIGESMYSVRALYLERGPRTVGTVTLGLPIDEEAIEKIAEAGGFEICLHYRDGCLVQTDGIAADPELHAAMLSSAGLDATTRVESQGLAWAIRSEPLIADQPEQGQRIIAVPLAGVVRPFNGILRALFLGGAGALVFSMLVGTALSRSLTRPVKALVAATSRVAEGDYETEVNVDSSDELGTLADAFNDMTRGLLMREQYRSVLNKVVSEDIAEELMKGDVELGGENRTISVLFADIRGFTPLTEGMEPQQVIGLLNECMECLSTAVDECGGVVDKFIGDEVMAVFGAPVFQPDHAARAVRAAVRMRDRITEMNAERTARGDGAVGVGIGVATGIAVAGNMGSSARMNYTVLGTTVNLAARLTGAAKAGEILLSKATHEAVADDCVGAELGSRSLKGFSSDVEVYAVQRMKDEPANTDAVEGSAAGQKGRAGAGRAASIGAAVALAASTLGSVATPGSVEAQWPTLADAGVGFLSATGQFQVDLSGQMDLESFLFSSSEPGLSGLASGSDVLFAPRVRLFLDTFYGDHVYGRVEWRGDRGEAPTANFWEARLEQAFLRVSNGSGSFSLQGGIFASPFGSYARRHMSVIDPFIRPPLPYDYRTVISRRWSPAGPDWLVEWKDNPSEWRPTGAPPIWGVPYQWGAMATVGGGFVTLRLAAMNSAPSSEPVDWYEFDVVQEVSWVGAIRLELSPELDVGASYNAGPYVRSDIPNAPELRPACCDKYEQRLWSVDAAFARGPAMLRAEFIHDSWDVPNIDDPAIDLGFTIEAQMDVAAGWSTAVRYGRIDFREIGGLEEWDWDVNRVEAAFGYRITANAGIMATYGTTFDSGPLDPDDNLAGVRLWWAF